MLNFIEIKKEISELQKQAIELKKTYMEEEIRKNAHFIGMNKVGFTSAKYGTYKDGIIIVSAITFQEVKENGEDKIYTCLLSSFPFGNNPEKTYNLKINDFLSCKPITIGEELIK